MKHGPIALLDESTPVVVVATRSPVLEKVVSNMQEVRARGARVIAVASEGDTEIGEHADEVIRVPPDRPDAGAVARGDPASADRVSHRAPARIERRPASQPGQDGHGRVSAPRTRIGLDLLEIDRLERALERRPALAERSSPTPSGPMRRRALARASTSRRASAPRRRSPKRLRCRGGASVTSRSSTTRMAFRRSRCTGRRPRRARELGGRGSRSR